MEGEEEGGGIRLSKRFNDKGGEVDYKTKSGTAWSHNFLNQKPWHPLSYPNQRRKWIAEQTNATHQRRSEEVAREFAQEQEFFRQTALVSKKEKEKIEMMKAVSFMYVRPPGYDAESAKAAEMAEERRNHDGPSHEQPTKGPSNSIHSEAQDSQIEGKKKSRPKDVFGRSLPTGDEFEVLKNAPKMDTGIAGRPKPFAVEIRNVKCLRCGTFGHQSGDRECILKDTITPNEESRLKRDDPLTAIMAQTEATEPLKWELKQRPGISPPRGGFTLDDPNQQIVAEDIFDEYGGFLNDGLIPELLVLPKKKKSTRKSKHKNGSSLIHDVMDPKGNRSSSTSSDNDGDGKSKRSKRREKKYKNKKHNRSTSCDDDSEADQPHRKNKQKHSSSKYHDSDDEASQPRKSKLKHSSSKYVNSDDEAGQLHRKNKLKHSSSKYVHSDDDDSEDDWTRRKSKSKHPNSYTLQDPDSSELRRKNKQKHSSSKDFDSDHHNSEDCQAHRNSKSKHTRSPTFEDPDSRESHRKNRQKLSSSKYSYSYEDDSEDESHRKRKHSNASASKYVDSNESYRSKHPYHYGGPNSEDPYRRRHNHQGQANDKKNTDAEDRYRSRHHHQDSDHHDDRHYSRHNHCRHD